MAIKKILVTLDQLSIDTSGFDERDPKDDNVFTPGETLQVVGRLGVARLTADAADDATAAEGAANLFNRSTDDAQSVAKGGAVTIASTAEISLSTGEVLQISGHLGGRDGTADFRYASPFELRYPFDLVAPDVLHLGPFDVAGVPLKAKLSVSVAQSV